MKSSTQSGDFINMGDLVMAIKNRKKRITARISALLLSAAMLCSLSACSDPVAVTKIKGTPTEAGAAESTLLHSVGDKANLQQVGKSGLIELLFDERAHIPSASPIFPMTTAKSSGLRSRLRRIRVPQRRLLKSSAETYSISSILRITACRSRMPSAALPTMP